MSIQSFRRMPIGCPTVEPAATERAMVFASRPEHGKPIFARTTLVNETPFPLYDEQRGERVPTVLLASGMLVRGNADQVVLVDSHRFSTCDSVRGSVREITATANSVTGALIVPYSDTDATQRKAWSLIAEEHITDIEPDFKQHTATYVRAGETVAIAGKQFTGPVKVVSSWELYAVSLVCVPPQLD